jgi:hypothetical protein
MKGNTLYSSEKRDYATLSMYQEWRTTAFWAKVIAVITYVLLSLAALGYLLILIALYFGGGELAPLFEGIIGSSIAIYVVSLFQVAVYFVINTFLFRFSKSLRMAVEERDQEVFENAWLSFRNYFRGIGALIIIFFLLSVIFVASVYSAL